MSKFQASTHQSDKENALTAFDFSPIEEMDPALGNYLI